MRASQRDIGDIGDAPPEHIGEIGDAPPESSVERGDMLLLEECAERLRLKVCLYADGVKLAERTVPYLVKGDVLQLS